MGRAPAVRGGSLSLSFLNFLRVSTPSSLSTRTTYQPPNPDNLTTAPRATYRLITLSKVQNVIDSIVAVASLTSRLFAETLPSIAACGIIQICPSRPTLFLDGRNQRWAASYR